MPPPAAAGPPIDRDAATVRERIAAPSSGEIKALEEEAKPTQKLDPASISERLARPAPSGVHDTLATPPSRATPPSNATPPPTPPPRRPSTLADASTPGGGTRADEAAAPGRKLALGRKLGAYELVGELGSGGMGVVYRARHAETGEVVALKVLLAGEYASARLRTRFDEEARAIQRLSHENIIPILDAGEIDHVAYYTMKLIEGDLLHDLMVRGQVDPTRGATILRDVARAAHHAHEHEIIHRDLKPSNVIVEKATGRPYVMDFGLAKDLGHDLGLSKSGVALGTPRYMSPEQAQGRVHEIDGRADVYAIGAMLYEVLAGRAPFEGESQTDLMRQIVEDEPAAPSQVQAGARLDLEAIALKALKKNRDDRYATAGDLAQDLERALAGEVPLAQSGRSPSAGAPGAARGDRTPLILAVVLGTVALVVVAAGAYAWKQAKERTRREHELAEQRRKDQEEALAQAKRREQLAQELEGATAKRALARSAPDAARARGLLEQAIAQLAAAQKLVEEGSETEARVLYETALARRDLGAPEGLEQAKIDLERAAGLKGYTARARALRASILHRRDHDPEAAKKEVALALAPSQPPEDAPGKAEEKAATSLAQAYDSLTEGDPATARVALRAAAAAEAPALADSLAELEAYTYLISAPSDEPSWHALQATRAAERGLQANRWRPDLLWDLAWARALASDVRRAEAALASAKEACPGSPDAFVPEAWIAVRQGRESVARARLEDGRKLQPAPKRFWDAIENRIGQALDARKTKPAPGMMGTRALWSDLPVVYGGRLGTRIEEVQAEIEEKKLDSALEKLAKLEEENQKHVGFPLWRARLLLEAGRFPEATEIVGKVLGKQADEPLGLTLQGILEARRGNLASGSDVFKKCVAAHPELRTPRMFLAQLATARRDWSTVTEALQKLCDDDEGDVDAAASLSLALLESAHPDEARDVAKRALDHEPRFAPARVAYARALRRTDHALEALAALDEGERLEPGLESIGRERVEALRALGRTDEADVLEKKLGK